MNNINLSDNLENLLNKNDVGEQKQIICDFFDLTGIENRLKAIEILAKKFPSLMYKQEVINLLYKNLIRPATKFRKDELLTFAGRISIILDADIQKRIVTAADYFNKQIKELSAQMLSMVKGLPEMTGDASRLPDLLGEVLHLLIVQTQVFDELNKNKPLTMIKKNARLSLAKSGSKLKKVEKDEVPLTHPILFEQLLQWRKAYSAKKALPLHIIIADKTLRRIAEKTPKTLDQLSALPGIGPAKAREIGQPLIDLINQYSGTQQLF